ncbi:MAG: 50S ribosomal protein L13 [Mariprofundaceae bacterium]
MGTWTYRPGDVQTEWYVIDAEGAILGRLATKVATVLRGKHRPQYTPHADLGDHVVVINADKVRLTGRKEDQKKYYRHSGYAGGLKTTSFKALREKYPERIVESAIRGMLPKTSLGRKMRKKLKVYAGNQHPHTAQQPKTLDMN